MLYYLLGYPLLKRQEIYESKHKNESKLIVSKLAITAVRKQATKEQEFRYVIQKKKTRKAAVRSWETQTSSKLQRKFTEFQT